jgi:hypothetical protein
LFRAEAGGEQSGAEEHAESYNVWNGLDGQEFFPSRELCA